MSEIIKNPVVAIAVFSRFDEESKTYFFEPIIKSDYSNEFIDPITMDRKFKLVTFVPLNSNIVQVTCNSIPLGFEVDNESVEWEEIVKNHNIP